MSHKTYGIQLNKIKKDDIPAYELSKLVDEADKILGEIVSKRLKNQIESSFKNSNLRKKDMNE